MRTHSACLMLCVILAVSMAGRAQSSYEVVSAARTLIERQVGDINKAAGEVRQALNEAVTANVGEFEKWRALAEAVDRYEQVFSGTVPLIDAQVKNMIDASPTASVPSIDVSSPFAPYIDGANEKIATIKRTITEQDQHIAELDQQIGTFREAIGQGSREYLGQALEGFIPTQEQLMAEGGLVVFGAYFGPPGILVTGIAAGAAATLNSFVNLYYNTQALADQAKAFTGMIEVLQRRQGEIRAARSKNQSALGEMQQVLRELEMHEQTYQQLREQLDKAAGSWGDYIESSRRKQAAEIDRKLHDQESRDQKPIKPVRYWPIPTPPPPIQPAEWMSDAQGDIASLADAVQSVLDGGDPRYVWDTLQGIREVRFRRQEAIAEEMRQAREQCDAAFRQYLKDREAAQKTRIQAWRRARNQAERDAADAAYYRALNAAIQRRVPSATVLMTVVRKRTIFSRANGEISSANDLLQQKLYNYIKATNNHFNTVVRDQRREWGEPMKELADHNRTAYNAWSALRGYSRVAGQLDWEIGIDLRQSTVRQVATQLRGRAEAIRRHGQELNRHLPQARSARTRAIAASTQTQGVVETLLARDGLLLAMQGWWPGLHLHSGFSLDPAQASMPAAFERLEENREHILTWVLRDFAVADPPEWWKDAQRANAEELARQFEQRADELEDAAAAQALFRWRLQAAMTKFEAIRRGLGADKEQDFTVAGAREQLAEEPWTEFVEVANAFPEEARNQLHQYDFTGWDQKSPRQRLMHLLIWLNHRAVEDFGAYVQSQRGRGRAFVPIPEGKYEEVKELWQQLAPALAGFDELAGTQRQIYAGAVEKVGAAWAPVPRAYAAVPKLGQAQVAREYRSAVNTANNLNAYLRTMTEGLQPIGSVDVRTELQNWIEKYPEQFNAYQERLEAARREQERREREAEELRKRQEEARRREAEQQRLREERQREVAQRVERFYEDFATNYKRKNAGALAAMLDDDWTAGDGSTIADLEETLRNSFRVFDEVECRITGLLVTPDGENQARVDYQIAIVGRIHRNRIKHEESSRVSEIVKLDGNKVRIIRTLSGRFWHGE